MVTETVLDVEVETFNVTLAIKFTVLSLVIILLVACSSPQPVLRTGVYHDKPDQERSGNVLNGLQLQALKLMNQQNFNQSILYLQRAIKVEPRNALNWHYLAQNYWHIKDYSACQSMVQRSMSYSQFDQDLLKENKILLQQCAE